LLAYEIQGISLGYEQKNIQALQYTLQSMRKWKVKQNDHCQIHLVGKQQTPLKNGATTFLNYMVTPI
jgi:hypothetical protein